MWTKRNKLENTRKGEVANDIRNVFLAFEKIGSGGRQKLKNWHENRLGDTLDRLFQKETDLKIF